MQILFSITNLESRRINRETVSGIIRKNLPKSVEEVIKKKEKVMKYSS